MFDLVLTFTYPQVMPFWTCLCSNSLLCLGFLKCYSFAAFHKYLFGIAQIFPKDKLLDPCCDLENDIFAGEYLLHVSQIIVPIVDSYQITENSIEKLLASM